MPEKTVAGSWTLYRQWLIADQLAALTVQWKEASYSTAQYVFICGPAGLVPTGYSGKFSDFDSAAAKEVATRSWFNGDLADENCVEVRGW